MENTGLLGFLQSPEGQGLLSAAFGGMAGARRGTPWNNVGRAGVAGIAGYGGALDRQAQLAETAKQNEMRDLQMGQLRRQVSTQQKKDAWRQQLPSLTTPQLTGQTEQEKILAEQNGTFGEDGARSLAQIGNLPGMNYGVDREKLNQHLMSPDSPFADKLLEQQLFPKASDYKVVGNSLVKIDTTKGTAAPVFSEQTKRTQLEELLDAAGIVDPALRRDFIVQAIKKQTTHAPAASNNQTVITGKPDSKYLETRLADQAQEIGKLGVQARSSYNQLGALDRFITASEKGVAGSAAPVISGLQNFLASFGYASDQLGSTQMMQQAVGDILGNKMSELGARGLTDKDMEVLRESLPRIESDQKARVAIARIIAKGHMRTIEEYENAIKSETEAYPDLQTRIPKAPWLSDYRKRKNEIGSRFADPQPAGNDLFNQADSILRGGR